MFKLDPRIQQDSKMVFDLELCQVRVQNDKRYPWLVLVPKVTNCTEVFELTNEQQIQLLAESSALSQALALLTKADKINVANLGNVVSQLHWHIVARFETDATWPGPIWGVGQALPYEGDELQQLGQDLAEKYREVLAQGADN